jgi:diguanylate cyclase (GGDEF)-like protein
MSGMDGGAPIEHFMPHGMCYLWDVRMLSLHVVSDAVIALAYFSIPLILLFFARKRRDLPFPGIFAMFGLFIVACGMTHVLDIWTIWHPTYWLAGGVKALTACVSIATAALLVRIVPQALKIKGRADLYQQLAELNATLERQVLERTTHLLEGQAQLAVLNERLQARTVEAETATRVMKAQENELKRLAVTDPLTGLANRRAFDDYLKREWRLARRTQLPLAMIMVDVDHFKEYNDCYGHPTGDACLKTIAAILRSNVKRPGDLVARYGGEEFVVLLPDTGSEGAEHVAELLRRAVRTAQIDHRDSPSIKFVTASFGVAVSRPDRDGSAAALLAAADEALYEAKSAGRDRVTSRGILASQLVLQLERRSAEPTP